MQPESADLRAGDDPARNAHFIEICELYPLPTWKILDLLSICAKLGSAMKKDYFSQPSPAIALHRSLFILQQKADELLNTEAGVGLSQVRIMSQLHFSVPRSQKTVATMLHQTEANVSRQLQAMKKEGLVNIGRNHRDRRIREVTLTSKGAKTYQKAEKVLESYYNQLEKMWGKSQSKDFAKNLGQLNKIF